MIRSAVLDVHEPVVTDATLREAIQGMLPADAGRPARILHIARRSSDYCTSAPLEELDVALVDGRRLRMMFKQTGRETMHHEARRVKPRFVHHPLREIEVYRQVLDPARLGTAACHGAVTDTRNGRYWLFLEKVAGVELYQVGALNVWERVARWLAAAHTSFARAGVPDRAARLPVLRQGPRYWRTWLHRARRFFADHDASSDIAKQLDRLARRHELVIEHLARMPTTFIHGELYASNVIVADGPAGVRVCPVDWEMAGVGPGMMDLAALTAGWPDREQLRIAFAYRDGLRANGAALMSREAMLRDLACCRIQAAIQWLGWFGRRRAPVEHARDWLGEATQLAAEMWP